MPKAILIENDVAKLVHKKASPKGLKFNKPVMFKLVLDVDSNAWQALDDDPLLQAKITEAASAEYGKSVEKVVKAMKEADRVYLKSQSKTERAKIAKMFENAAKSELMSFEKKGTNAAQKAWEDVKKTKSDYTKYKVKAAVDLGLDALDVGLGVAGAVGTGGISLVLSIIGIIKTLVGMAMKIYKLAKSADKMQKRVRKNLEKVQKSFKKNKRELSGAKDTGKAFVNTLLGADFLPTVKTVKADNDQYGDKLNGVDVKSHDLSKALQKVLKQLDAAKKKPDVVGSKKVQKMIGKLEKQVHKLVTSVIDLQEKVTEGRTFQEETATAIKEIETFEPKKWKVLTKGMKLIDIAMAGGDFESVASVLEGIGTAVGKELAAEINDRV